jgi:hypothetical protein
MASNWKISSYLFKCKCTRFSKLNTNPVLFAVKKGFDISVFTTFGSKLIFVILRSDVYVLDHKSCTNL